MRYASVKFPRSGLANKLFVLARAVVFCARHEAMLLQPNYFSFKIGPVLRGETDLRTYRGLFRCHPTAEIGGLRRAFLQVSGKKLLESEAPVVGQGYSTIVPDNTITVFRRTRETFEGINGFAPLLSDYLGQITQPRWLEASNRAGPIDIGVHVRLGDLGGPQRHPIEWYVGAVAFLREIVGPIEVSVFSDGKDQELQALKRLPHVRVIRTGSAIGDLLALSRARFLVGTGSSTFSAWAVYLGQMPSMTRVGNPFSWWQLENIHGRYMGEWNPDSPGKALLHSIQSIEHG